MLIGCVRLDIFAGKEKKNEKSEKQSEGDNVLDLPMWRVCGNVVGVEGLCVVHACSGKCFVFSKVFFLHGEEED